MKSKLILTTLLVLSGMSINAQISLENTYPNTGYFKLDVTGGPQGFYFGNHALYLVHLEIDGDKYVDIDRLGQILYFYNLNHTLFKTINYSNVYTGISFNPVQDKTGCSVLYISQNLFDTDSAIEFMYNFLYYHNADTSWRAITQIVKEDGSIMFSDSAAPVVKLNVHNQYYPVYNTTNGTKMILSNVNGTAEVFSLPGTFTNSIAGNNILNQDAEMNLFPNPAINQDILTINYKLPEKIKTAVLVITDAQGKQIKSFEIGNAMNSIFINISDFAPGVYLYSILTKDGGTIESKKNITIQ